MESQEAKVLIYSNRVMLKTIFEGSSDDKMGLVGKTVVVGGWVKSSKEVKKETAASPQTATAADAFPASPGPKDASCEEILQSRIPFFRTIVRVLGGSTNSPADRERLRSLIPKLPPPSTFYLQINDGSCVSSLQAVIDSLTTPLSAGHILPTGTCILAQGVVQKPSAHEKQTVELKVEKILHVGTVEQDKYPLSRKRLPLDSLRDYSHIRPRTTTVASVTRIRSTLDFATHTFFQNHGFLHVQVPIITTIDSEGFSEKFQITTLLGTTGKGETVGVSDADGANLETIRAAMKEKSSLAEQLKKSESNREALVAAHQDLRKTNELAQQIEAKDKSKPVTALKPDLVNLNEDFFGRQSYLTVSGHLHLESYACALGHVYSFGPRFRADKTVSSKIVAERWTVEVEMAFSELEDAMKCAEDCFKFQCRWILDKCSEDMKFVSKRIDKNAVHRLEYMISNSYEKIPYREAVEILRKVTDKAFETQLRWGVPLTAEHLSYMADDHYRKPVIVYDYPKAVKPFYVRLNDDGKTVAAFEMVVPKIGTVITGSQNEERFDMLNARIKEFDLSRDEYEWYLDLGRHGAVKHSGFSLGFDLMLLLTTGLTDIRDATPFPRSHGKVNN